jgi:hypothetical protein
LDLLSVTLHAGSIQLSREAFKRTDKHIHLLGVNGESLKFMFEMVKFGKNTQMILI